MIDTNARNRLQQDRQYKRLVDGMPKPIPTDLSSLDQKSGKQITLITLLLSTMQSIVDYLPKMLSFLPSREDIKDINRNIARIPQPKLEVPDEMTLNPVQIKILKDAIDAIKFPDIPSKVTVNNLERVIGELEQIKKTLNLPKIEESIKKVEVLNQKTIDLSPLINELRALRLELPDRQNEKPIVSSTPIDVSPIVEAIDRIPAGTDNTDIISKLNQLYEVMSALYNRPQMTTPPVTHVSINSMNGSIKTSQIQLGSTVTPLPAIPLVNRRAVQIYNNGSHNIFVGGATVTASTGIPVTPQSYSDIFGIGINVTVYGISNTGQNNDIRVLEISDESSGR